MLKKLFILSLIGILFISQIGFTQTILNPTQITNKKILLNGLYQDLGFIQQKQTGLIKIDFYKHYDKINVLNKNAESVLVNGECKTYIYDEKNNNIITRDNYYFLNNNELNIIDKNNFILRTPYTIKFNYKINSFNLYIKHTPFKRVFTKED